MLVTFIIERTDDILISKKSTYEHKLKRKRDKLRMLAKTLHVFFNSQITTNI